MTDIFAVAFYIDMSPSHVITFYLVKKSGLTFLIWKKNEEEHFDLPLMAEDICTAVESPLITSRKKSAGLLCASHWYPTDKS